MEKVFVAGRRLKIGDDLRFPGDPVPEVALFTERQKRVLLNTGHVILKGLDELNPDQHEKLSQYLEKMQPKHVGGGVYELPTGRRVKGKEKAFKAVEALGFFLGEVEPEAKKEPAQEEEDDDKVGEP